MLEERHGHLRVEKNAVVPIPKKRSRGVCRVDGFHRISLVADLYKAVCSVVQCRLVHSVEEGSWRLKSKRDSGWEEVVETS